MKEFLFAMSLGFGLCIMAHAANAQQANCAERGKILKKLSEKYGEIRQTIGLVQNNAIVETFASIETGTWTILLTRPSGIACLVASGHSFDVLTEKPKAEGA